MSTLVGFTYVFASVIRRWRREATPDADFLASVHAMEIFLPLYPFSIDGYFYEWQGGIERMLNHIPDDMIDSFSIGYVNLVLTTMIPFREESDRLAWVGQNVLAPAA